MMAVESYTNEAHLVSRVQRSSKPYPANQKAVIIRLFPNKQQNIKMRQCSGVARWTWNWGLALQRQTYEREHKTLSFYELSELLTQTRNEPQYSWLRDVSRHTENYALRDLDKAYKNFYRRLKNGEHGGLPRFKAKGQCVPSFCTRSEKVYTSDGRIYLEKIGHVRYKSHIDLSGVRFRNARVKFENGKWLLKAAVELDAETPAPALRDSALGVDVGIKSLAVVSMSGRKRVFKNINRTHKMRRLVKQLKHHQRALARKQKGSANRLKERVRVRELYGRLKRLRHDYIEKVTRAIVDMRPRVIVLEDLNISGMMKNSHIARAVAEQNLYLFRLLLERKAAESGIAVKFADRFFPSSKTCSGCGHVRETLRLNERVYKCPECGLEIDRDYNAALNLESLAY